MTLQWTLWYGGWIYKQILPFESQHSSPGGAPKNNTFTKALPGPLDSSGLINTSDISHLLLGTNACNGWLSQSKPVWMNTCEWSRMETNNSFVSAKYKHKHKCMSEVMHFESLIPTQRFPTCTGSRPSMDTQEGLLGDHLPQLARRSTDSSSCKLCNRLWPKAQVSTGLWIH